MTVAILIAHHLSAAVVSIGFAVSLVVMLVTVEERDLRRQNRQGIGQPHS